VILFAQLLVRASVDLFLSPLNSKEFSESLVLCFFKLVHMIVVQFSMSFVSLAVCQQLVYYITFASVCQEVFQTFFKFFRGPFRISTPLVGSLYIISQALYFVKRFFKLF